MSPELMLTLKPGDKVVLSNAGKTQGMRGRANSEYGIFLRATPCGRFMIVRRDGILDHNTFSPEFWDLENVTQ